VDNGLGYTIDNVTACCVNCNRAKHSRTLPEFIDWALRLVEHLRLTGRLQG
jgi:5-methylcytosine-specific restriction endonuclease McrA